MNFCETGLPGAFVVELSSHRDERGEFARAYCRETFAARGLTPDFVQGNVSVNPHKGTLRGLHYQTGDHAETKLVRCGRGAVYDVIVDLRPGSPTCRKWFGVELRSGRLDVLYVPAGFAHGFQALEDDTEVTYLVSAAYAPEAAHGVRYDDPALSIPWPLPVSCISRADLSWPPL